MLGELSSNPVEIAAEPAAAIVGQVEVPAARVQRMSTLSESEKQLLDALVVRGHREWHGSLLLVLPSVLLWFAIPSEPTAKMLALLCVASQAVAYVYLQRQYSSMERVLSRYMHYCSRLAFHQRSGNR
jgi:hypothetical protein